MKLFHEPYEKNQYVEGEIWVCLVCFAVAISLMLIFSTILLAG